MNNPIPSQEATAEPVQIFEVLPTKIWIENGVFGERAVLVQHEGMEPFEYAVFNYRYGYTDNLSTYCSAENLARSLGAAEPVEHRQRSLPPTPAADQQTERVAPQVPEYWVGFDLSDEIEPPMTALQLFVQNNEPAGIEQEQQFREELQAVVDEVWRGACFAGGSPARDVEAPAATALIPEGWQLERKDEHNIVVWKPGIGGYAATDDEEHGIAANILFLLAADLMAAAPIGSDK
jgi:hypothetical protein